LRAKLVNNTNSLDSQMDLKEFLQKINKMKKWLFLFQAMVAIDEVIDLRISLVNLSANRLFRVKNC